MGLLLVSACVVTLGPPNGSRHTGVCLFDSLSPHLAARGKQASPVAICGHMGYIWLFLLGCSGYPWEASIWMVVGYAGVGLAVSSCLCWLPAGGKPSNGAGHTAEGLAVSDSLCFDSSKPQMSVGLPCWL